MPATRSRAGFAHGGPSGFQRHEIRSGESHDGCSQISRNRCHVARRGSDAHSEDWTAWARSGCAHGAPVAWAADLKSSARRLQELIRRLQPELVHAMRIPYEGMVAALARPSMPLLISVWGNDFTLHARSTPLMAA